MWKKDEKYLKDILGCSSVTKLKNKTSLNGTYTNRNKKQYIPDINPANFNIFLTPDKSDHKMITLGFDIKLFPESKKNNIRSSVSSNNNSSVNSRANTVIR